MSRTGWSAGRCWMAAHNKGGSMPPGWRRAIIAGWIVTAVFVVYLIWGHWSQKNWDRAMRAAAMTSHDAQQNDINRIGPAAIPGFVPTDPTPGDWPPPEPPNFP
jgi:hypothetical protein